MNNKVGHVIEKLNENGYKAYLVGGWVRDYLMGLEAHDFDVTTSAKPDEVKEVFKGQTIVDTGLKHGTVTLVLDGEPIEITTFRRESEYSDGRQGGILRKHRGGFISS